MTHADWLKVPGYGQRGVDILADLEAAENELDLVDTALARRQALDDCPTRYDKIIRACSVASRAEKAEAERDALLAALRKAYEPGVREIAIELIKALNAYAAIPVDQGMRHRKADAGRELWYRQSLLEAALASPSLPADVAELLGRCEG